MGVSSQPRTEDTILAFAEQHPIFRFSDSDTLWANTPEIEEPPNDSINQTTPDNGDGGLPAIIAIETRESGSDEPTVSTE